MLEIDTDREKEDRIFVIQLRGRMDAVTAGEFEKFFSKMIRAGNRFFIVKAFALEYVSSAGVSALVQFARSLDGVGGDCAFLDMNREIRMLISFFGLSERFAMFDDLDSARRHLEKKLAKANYSLEIEEEELPSEEEPPEAPPPVEKTASAPEPPPPAQHVVEPLLSPGEEISPQRVVEEILPAREGGASSVFRPRIDDREEPPISKMHQAQETIRETASVGDSQTPRTRARSPQPGRPVAVFSPDHIAPCEQCGVNLRFYRSGDHKCPACGIRLSVRPDGTAAFHEKL